MLTRVVREESTQSCRIDSIQFPLIEQRDRIQKPDPEDLVIPFSTLFETLEHGIVSVFFHHGEPACRDSVQAHHCFTHGEIFRIDRTRTSRR